MIPIPYTIIYVDIRACNHVWAIEAIDKDAYYSSSRTPEWS